MDCLRQNGLDQSEWIGSDRMTKSVQNRNPYGEKKAGMCLPCNVCVRPVLGSAWSFLREHEQGETIPRGATCQRCEWVSLAKGSAEGLAGCDLSGYVGRSEKN